MLATRPRRANSYTETDGRCVFRRYGTCIRSRCGETRGVGTPDSREPASGACVAHCRVSRNTTLRGRVRILRGVSQTFGERLRALRTRKHLTPSALAHAVGVTEGAIRQMESGQTKIASLIVGLRLADFLGVTAWFLATGSDAAPGTGSRSPEEPAQVSRVEVLHVRVNALDRRVKVLEAQLPPGRRRKGGE